jgi:hypothetical protein
MLRRFSREGTPWRGLSATANQASGSTLRRCLARWAETGLLGKVHVLLVSMRHGHPDLILDTCIVTAANVNDTLLFERLFLAALSWPGSARCLRTRAMMPRTTATSVAGSAPSLTSTSAVGRADQGLVSGSG